MLLRVILVLHVGKLPATGGARQENGELPALLLIWSWILSQPHTCLYFRHWEESRSFHESWSHTSVTSKMLLHRHHHFLPIQSNCTKRLYYFASFFVSAALEMEFKALYMLPSALPLSTSLLFTCIFKHLYMCLFHLCMYVHTYVFTCHGTHAGVRKPLAEVGSFMWLLGIDFRLSSSATSIFIQ